MRKITSVGALMAVLAGVLMLLAPTAANAASAESVYTKSWINRCADVSGSNTCVGLEAWSTYSASQIWVNGHVLCTDEQGNVQVTWCGVGGGNGTATLNVGVNFNFGRVTGLYERMNIFANGNGCSTWGSNSNVNGITKWWNGGPVTCEEPTSGPPDQ